MRRKVEGGAWQRAEAMGKFGEDLRKAREARGVALDTIVQATKISVRYLQAVEQERFDQLPGGLFNKSIVRSYARTVGLPEEEWVTRFLEVTNALTEPDPAAEDHTWNEFAQNVGRSRARDPNRSNHRLRWAGVAVLLALVMGLSWFVWGYVHHKVQLGSLAVPTQSVADARR
jgi:cytoskeleton protein RodZ